MMPSITSLDAAQSLAFGAGLVQLALAATFWGGRHSRPDWGPRWLALSFACSAAVNLASTVQNTGQRQPLQPLYLLLVVLGLTALAALVIGVRQFVGRHGRHPASVFVAVLVWMLGGATLLRLLGLEELAGHLATVFIFGYLAWLVAHAMPGLTGAAHRLLLLSVLLYPLLVLLALATGIERARVSLWAALPYSITGLGLLVAGLGRYHQELGAELQRRERAESELRQLNQRLEQHVGERTAELQERVGELRSFNRMVAHDLRGPLGGLVGLSTLAQQALDGGEPQRVSHMLAVMGKELQRLLGLVSELLALARATQGDLERQPTDLGALRDEALSALRISLGAPAVARIARTPLPVVDADPALLRQVLLNLLANALKFSQGRPDTAVEILAQRQGAELVVEVRDHGVGFEPARAADLFRPFGRLHGEAFTGTGIGLSIVRRIVERHGGRVWAQGRPGAGASFFFSLPATTPDGAEAADRERAASAQAPG